MCRHSDTHTTHPTALAGLDAARTCALRTQLFQTGSFFSSVMWPWTCHVPLKVSPVCPSAEWGSISHLLPRSVSLQHLHAFQPGADITWSLCTRSSQRQDDLAQNGAETVLDGLWDQGTGTPFLPILRPAPNGQLKGRLESHLLLYQRGPNFRVLFFH